MYKFTNGIVVFDEETKNAYIKAGMVLEENKVESPKETDILNDAKGNEETRRTTKEDKKELRKKC